MVRLCNVPNKTYNMNCFLKIPGICRCDYILMRLKLHTKTDILVHWDKSLLPLLLTILTFSKTQCFHYLVSKFVCHQTGYPKFRPIRGFSWIVQYITG